MARQRSRGGPLKEGIRPLVKLLLETDRVDIDIKTNLMAGPPPLGR